MMILPTQVNRNLASPHQKETDIGTVTRNKFSIFDSPDSLSKPSVSSKLVKVKSVDDEAVHNRKNDTSLNHDIKENQNAHQRKSKLILTKPKVNNPEASNKSGMNKKNR